MSQTAPSVLFEVNDQIGFITLNRPESANGLTLKLSEEFFEITESIKNDTNIKAIILSAHGKMFCAGGDLPDFASQEKPLSKYVNQMTEKLHQALMTLHTQCPPIVVAINGTVAGGGLGIAMCGDYVIACEKAKFTSAYTNAGLSPDCSTSYFLPRLVGLRKAQNLILNNTILSANDALDIGLISEICSAESLQERALDIAKKWTRGSRQSNLLSKQLVNTSMNHEMPVHLQHEATNIALCVDSKNGMEGIQAFSEKRAPKFE